MTNYCKKAWDARKDLLWEEIQKLEECPKDYKELVEMVVKYIFNDPSNPSRWRDFGTDDIREIDDGDWQGTLIYLIYRNTYTPDAGDYIMTTVDYGSCGYCDILQGIGEDFCRDRTDQAHKDLFSLCLHLVQETVKPFNTGWRHDPEWDHIKEED